MDTSHRCDQCGAQARVATRVHGSTLEWCQHHWRVNELKLTLAGAVVVTNDTAELENA